MSLALVSDIHGNRRALAAVVDELERLEVREAICLGDAVQGGDEPREVLAGGHARLQWTRVIGGALYVNPRSVGVSDDGLAQFALLTDRSVAFKRVAWNGS